MLLGLLLAYVPISSISLLDPRTLAANVNRFPEVLPLLLPATILVIPYADMLMAVIRRTRAGRSPFAPDRKHLHHRLLDIGHSHRLSVLIMYLWAALFSGLIIWFSTVRTPLFVFGVITLGAIVALLLMSMPRLRWWKRARRPGATATAAVAQPTGTVAPAVALPIGTTPAAVARPAWTVPAAAGQPAGTASAEVARTASAADAADGGSPAGGGRPAAAEPGDRRAARPGTRPQAAWPRSVVGTLPPVSAHGDAVPLGAPVPNGTVTGNGSGTGNGRVAGNGSGTAPPGEVASRDAPAPDLLTQETLPIPVYDPAARPADRPPSRGR
jgi:UDP-GlcNAc:undecaprenyl-phosphate/decaprenyl-phosphate GlcNAc-1-phosphate transferase